MPPTPRANHDLLPELRRKLVINTCNIEYARHALAKLNAHLERLEKERTELLELIDSNNYFSPPPRPM